MTRISLHYGWRNFYVCVSRWGVLTLVGADGSMGRDSTGNSGRIPPSETAYPPRSLERVAEDRIPRSTRYGSRKPLEELY